MREKPPWLVFIWCIAHRLELSLNDALKDTDFKEVDEMLLQLHLLYRKAPKRLSQLKELHDIYKETLEFEEGCVKPRKANGSRWISHKLAALKMCKDKWRLHIKHLEKMRTKQSHQRIERDKKAI